jgi:hypothetical protein
LKYILYKSIECRILFQHEKGFDMKQMFDRIFLYENETRKRQ